MGEERPKNTERSAGEGFMKNEHKGRAAELLLEYADKAKGMVKE